MDRSTKQKINKETQTLNDTIDQLDLTDICRTFQASFLITVQKYYMSTTGKKLSKTQPYGGETTHF